MAKHACNPRNRQIREVVEFGKHIDDLSKRIRGINVRKMVNNS